MGIITRARQQTAIWWEQSGTDIYGRVTLNAPVEIECRWDGKIERMTGPDGDEFVSKAEVMVDRAMTTGDYLKLGTLDSSTESDARDEPDAYMVKTYMENPNLRNTETLRRAYL